MSAIPLRNKRHLLLFLARRKRESGYSIRQLSRLSGVPKSNIERLFKEGVLDMGYENVVRVLVLLKISPTQVADTLGLIEPIPESEDTRQIVEAAYQLSQLEEADRQAIIRIINFRFEMLEGREQDDLPAKSNHEYRTSRKSAPVYDIS